MIPLLMVLSILGSTTFASPIVQEDCPCYNLMTCIDSELSALNFGVTTYTGYQGYYNNTINNVLSNIEDKLGLSEYRFPPTRGHFNVPLCTFPESQTNEIYKSKVRYLNTLDSNFVTTKKRWEDLFNIYSTRLANILAHLEASDDES